MAKKVAASKASRKDAKGASETRPALTAGETTGPTAAAPVEPATAVEGREPGKARSGGRAAAKKAAAVTLTDIGDHLAATFDMPKAHAKIYLAEAVALIAKQLRKGARIRLSGLGVFEVKKRPARKARNPNTGEVIKVKAGKRLVFSAARDLKAKL